MIDRISAWWGSFLDGLGSLSLPALGIVGILILGAVGGSGFYAYQTYDYVQHDNDFCLSCHLMAEPYELFAESAHQGLTCKACHQPTLVARSQMAISQIVENPEELSAHAEVPNEICADCHINGDPEKWRMIANTAGHRAHLESDADELTGLQCVECHSTSLHEFAPTDQTCAQSGCHDDNTIQLGGMSELTIHCAACHSFVAPVTGSDGQLASNLLGGEVGSVILPDSDECFTCHVMRTLVEMPDPDPHLGSCAACHNPHEQTEPSDAAETCATSGCHAQPDTLSAHHRGISEVVLSECLGCHQAHDFALDGTDCASCHESGPMESISDFSHDEHETAECASCHVSVDGHAVSTVTTIQDCRSCHHTAPVSVSCDRCHAPQDAPVDLFHRIRPMVLEVGTNDPRRSMTSLTRTT